MKKFWLYAFLVWHGMIYSGDLAEYRQLVRDNDWSAALQTAIDRTGDGTLCLPPGHYLLKSPLVVSKNLMIIFEGGAVLEGSGEAVMIHRAGELVLEGRGAKGRLVGKNKKGCLIDLNQIQEKSDLSLTMRNMELAGINGISGGKSPEPIRSLEIYGSQFSCSGVAVGVNGPELGQLRIENSIFDGPDRGIFILSPIPNGAVVRGNMVRNAGRQAIRLGGGKATQIADGCTTYMLSAQVHENQILGGGHRASVRDSYIHGILIYGHNVSVQGNIIRDFNRGEPVPGAACGHHIPAADGTSQRGRLIDTDTVKGRRLAGSAIYLKANRSIVQGNICTNSGWRSVIEIKTGGKEHFVSVVNNVVDGRSLAIDDSYVFECNSGYSLWSGNLVYDVPDKAFAVRSGCNNTFRDNVIINAKIGFALSGVEPGRGEMIAGNRFVNVEREIAVQGNSNFLDASGIFLPPPTLLADPDELPAPGPPVHGRMLIMGGKLLVCVSEQGQYFWKEFSGVPYRVRQWQVNGPELLFNSDQSTDRASGNTELDNPLHRGWRVTMRSAREEKLEPSGEYISYDRENFRTGNQSLKIAFKDTSGTWILSQPARLKPGRRYRLTALVRGEEPRNLKLNMVFSNRVGRQVQAENTADWQMLSLDFTTPAKVSSGTVQLQCSHSSDGKAAWLDSVSLKELIPAGPPTN